MTPAASLTIADQPLRCGRRAHAGVSLMPTEPVSSLAVPYGKSVPDK